MRIGLPEKALISARSAAEISRAPVDAAGRYGSKKLPLSVSSVSGPLMMICPPQCSQSNSACCCSASKPLGEASSQSMTAMLVQSMA